MTEPGHRPETETDLAAEVEHLRAQLAKLTDRLEAIESGAPAGRPAPETASAPSAAPAIPVAMDRRSAIKRGAGMAAAAVVGGAAVVANTPGTAAAATVNGSGNPGVLASGVNGYGVSATTDSDGFAAVKATTSVNGSIGLLAVHAGNGNALRVTGGAGSTAAADITSLTTAIGLKVTSEGTAVNLDGTTGAEVTGTDLAVRLKATKNHLELASVATSPPTRSTFHTKGTIAFDVNALWLCTQSGSPGTWTKLGGLGAAGAFHPLTTPVRIYDSRPGTSPAVGTKSPLVSGVARTLDLKANSSGVPAGATAAMVTLLLVNAAAGNGNATLWRNGVAKPSSNTLVWGPSGGRFAITAITALDATAQCQISASLATDVVIDVVGYYR